MAIRQSSQTLDLARFTIISPLALRKKTGADRALEAILIYDILLVIAPKLHYMDFVNLSMVSKSVRAVMFPVSKSKDKERELRMYRLMLDMWHTNMSR